MMWVEASTYTPSPSEIAARRARLMGRGQVINIAPKRSQRPEEPADAHVKAWREYLDQMAKAASPASYIRLRCKVLNLPYDEIMSRTRVRAIIADKHRLIAEVRARYSYLSLPQIGRLFGGMDHTSVLNALKKMGHQTEDRRIPDETVAEMKRLYAEGVPIMEIARRLGTYDNNVRNYVIEGYREAMQAKDRARRKARAK